MKDDQRQQRFVRASMDPQRLQHFLAVYEHGNFGQAAKATHVTQQAVSKAIGRLESQLGVPLFERSAFGAQPTAYAHALAKRAKIIQSESRLAMAELSAMRGSTAGFVQVGIGWSFFPRIAPDAIARFRAQRPGVGLRIVGGTTATLLPDLLRGDLDFVVSAPPTEHDIDPGVETQTLFIERDVVTVRVQHPLAQQDGVTLKQLSTCTWLVSMSIPDRWNAICAAFAAYGIEPPAQVIDLDSLSLAKSMLLRGDYVCLLSEELVAPELEAGQCKAFRLDALPLSRPALLATRRGADLPPVASVLRTHILDICREHYPSPPDN